MRVLGIDWGGARIGVAVAETDPVAMGLRPPIPAAGKLKLDAQAIAARAKKEEVAAIVLGLPVELDGAEGKMARIVRQLGGHLATDGWTVEFASEEFSSVEAEANLQEQDLRASERRKRRDGEAAVVILELWLRSREANSLDNAPEIAP